MFTYLKENFFVLYGFWGKITFQFYFHQKRDKTFASAEFAVIIAGQSEILSEIKFQKPVVAFRLQMQPASLNVACEPCEAIRSSAGSKLQKINWAAPRERWQFRPPEQIANWYLHGRPKSRDISFSRDKAICFWWIWPSESAFDLSPHCCIRSDPPKLIYNWCGA